MAEFTLEQMFLQRDDPTANNSGDVFEFNNSSSVKHDSITLLPFDDGITNGSVKHDSAAFSLFEDSIANVSAAFQCGKMHNTVGEALSFDNFKNANASFPDHDDGVTRNAVSGTTFPFDDWMQGVVVGLLDEPSSHIATANRYDEVGEDSVPLHLTELTQTPPSFSPPLPHHQDERTAETFLTSSPAGSFSEPNSNSPSESSLTSILRSGCGKTTPTSLTATPPSPSSFSSSSSSSVIDSAGEKDKEETRDGSKKSRKKWANPLPPCRVCGEAASGLHYGVNTCEACKMFFKRCVNRKRPLRCKGNSQRCNVRGNRRVVCRTYCRYHWARSGSGLTMFFPCVLCTSSNLVSCASREQPEVQREGDRRVVCAYCRYHWCLQLGMSRDSIKMGRYTCKLRDHNSKEVSRAQLVTPTSVPEDEVTKLQEQLLEAHKEVFTSWDLTDEEIVSRAKSAAERTELEQQLFGRQGYLSEEEYHQIYQETGLDVDGREKYLRDYAINMERQIRGFVHFAKGIPGFCHLPLDDQASLVKASRAELMMLGIYRGFNRQYKSYVNPAGHCFHARQALSALSEEMEELEFSMADRLRRLNVLSKGELVLMKAICLMCSDRCELEAKERVEEIQWRLICAFLKSLQVNNAGRDEIRFSYVIDCLTELRTMTDMSRKALDTTPLAAVVFQKNPLLVEVMLK